MSIEQKVDIVVLTVLQEEYEAVAKRLSHLSGTAAALPNQYAWQLGQIQAQQYDAPYSVALGKIGRAGNVQSALAVKEAIDTWKPTYIVFVGIAGGLGESSKGDVVISDTIYGYEYGKVTKEFAPRDNWTYRSDQGLVNSAERFARDYDGWQSVVGVGAPEETKPVVRRGDVASGDKVVDDATNAFFRQVRNKWPRLLAIEMEGAGASAAIEQAASMGCLTKFLMIRGISDLPNVNMGSGPRGTPERDAWKTFSANAAAAFVIAFVRTGLPEPPSNSEPTVVVAEPSAERLRELGLGAESDQSFGSNEYTQDLGLIPRIFEQAIPASHYVLFAALPTQRVDLRPTEVGRIVKSTLGSGWLSAQNTASMEPKYWPPKIFLGPLVRGSPIRKRNAFVWEERFQQSDLVFSRLGVTDSADVVFVKPTRFVSIIRDDVAIFSLGHILASCWSLAGLTLQVYKNIGYSAKTYFCIAFVNALNSHLGGWADQRSTPEVYQSAYWRDVTFTDHRCHSTNLKFYQVIDLSLMTPKVQPGFIKDFAEMISLEYNFDSPRCFSDEGRLPEEFFRD